MSKKEKQQAKAIEPIRSEYDVYAGLYLAHPPRVAVGEASFAVVDNGGVLANFADGAEVIIGGSCEYASQEDAQNCERLPVSMVVKTCYPR